MRVFLIEMILKLLAGCGLWTRSVFLFEIVKYKNQDGKFLLRSAERVCARSGLVRERRQKSEERNTNREGVASGGATLIWHLQSPSYYNPVPNKKEAKNTVKSKEIKSILIVNRGEIACRIIRTAKQLGIKSVAIYSDIDKNALFVERADEAIPLEGIEAKDTYLNTEKIIDVAKRAGVDERHHGYGI